jgi:hypothetical protein
MSNLDDLRKKLAKAEASAHFDSLLPKSSGWLSRKLIVVLAVIAALILLGRDNQSAIISGIITLGVVYLIVQAVQDLGHSASDAYARGKLIEAMAKDGLDANEIAAITGQKPPGATITAIPAVVATQP